MTRIGTMLVLVAALAVAEPWNMAVDANLTVNQNAYSNWEGGANGLLAYALNSNSLAEKQLNPKISSFWSVISPLYSQRYPRPQTRQDSSL